MKRVLSFIMVMALVFSMIPAVYAAEAEVVTSGTNVAATVAEPVTYTWTPSANGTLTVTMGAASPGWRYAISDAAGNTVGLPKSGSTEKSAEFELVAGTTYTFRATGWSSSAWEETTANITYTLTFVPAEDEDEEIVKTAYEVSDTALVLGDNTLTLLETAVTTIYVYEPTETGVFTFTAPAGALVGYWGAGSWFLTDPNSTTNTCEWTCTGVGQKAYIGVSGVEGNFTLNVAKTGDYEVVETPIVTYVNKATLETFTLPDGAQLHGYIDVTTETKLTAVLGEDGYYHLNSADGDVILVDMNYQDIVLSNALKSDRPVMYAYTTDENGNDVKYDIGAAVQEYEAVMDENGYYPLTEDLILFYDTYAVGAGTYTFYVTSSYNEENVWMYCMRTVTMPEVTETTEPETTEPEASEPETSEPETSEPETSEPKTSEPETSEPTSEPSESTDPNALISVSNEAVTASGYVFEYTAATAGTLHVSVGECSPGWRYKVFSPDGIESGYRSKYTAGTECDYHNVAGDWKIVFYAYSSTEADNVDGTVSFTVTFTPDEATGGETEPVESEPVESEPVESEPEASEPEVSETTSEPSEPADPDALVSVSNEAVTASGYVFEYTAATAGTLHVSVGECSPGWRYKVFSPDGVESGYRSKYTAGTECDYHNVAGDWKIVFYAYSSTEADNVDGTVSFTVTFTPDEVEETTPTEPEKNAYEVSDATLSVGSNTLTMLDTAVTTVFKFKPTEAGTYTFAAAEGVVVGNWGTNASYLTDPNSTANTCEWTCSSVGQSVFIGVSGSDAQITLTVTKAEEPTEPTEPTTEPTVPEESETTAPAIPDEDVPADAYYSITIDGTTTYYSTSGGATLNSNLKTITGSAYVKFYQDMTLGSSYTIDVLNGNITLDLNGCTISSAYKAAGTLYVSGGTVTVVDSSAEGDGLLQNTATGFGIEVYTGSVTMLGGNAQGVQGAKVWTASFEMQGGTVSGSSYGINALANSTVTISGGEIIQSTTGSFKYALYAASTANVTVNGGYLNGTVSGSGLNGKIAGGYFTSSVSSAYIASGCEIQTNDDSVYTYKVVDPNAEATEPTEPESSEPETTAPETSAPEATEPETSEPEATEPETSEPEATEPETSEPEATEPETSEPAASGVITSGTNVSATATEPVTYTWTPSANGTLTVTMGAASPGWRYAISDAAGNTVGLPKSGSTEKSAEFELVAGTTYTFRATGWNSSAWEEVSASITYTLTFVPAEEEDEEIVKTAYEVSDTALALGDNTLTLLETAVTTIYVYEPTETGVFTFTAPAGALVGYWGAGSWFLTDPNSTTNTCEWTCTGVGQKAYIGVSGVEGSFTLNVAKTGDYEVVETPIILYENKATLETFTLPEGAQLHGYIDVTTETKLTAVLGEDGYYHLNSADGDVILVDMNYQDIVLSDALKSDRPVMYAYTTDENGNDVKYDIGAAIQEYEAVMDENGYYPLTEDLILFYDTYAVGAGTYTFYVTSSYNEENVWMYCMRTVTMPEVTEPESIVEQWNLVLDDDLLVNFHLNISDDIADTAQVQITVGDNSTICNVAEMEKTEDGKYIASVHVAAAQMTDAITVQLVGSEDASQPVTYTVRQYADTVLADESLSQYHALIKEMLNYGAAAQTYFEYTDSGLANDGIEGVGASEVPESADNEMSITGSASGIAFYGASLIYQSKIAVRLYFKAESVEGLTFTVNGTACDATAKGEYYMVEVTGIDPESLGEQITVTVTDTDGNVLTVSYGPMNYIVRMNAKGSENLKALMKAMYNYHLAAKALRTSVA